MGKHPGPISGKEMLPSHDDFITRVLPVLQACDFGQYRGAGNTYELILDMASTYAQDAVFSYLSQHCVICYYVLCFFVHFWICCGGFLIADFAFVCLILLGN